jgi:hypothetical protein
LAAHQYVDGIDLDQPHAIEHTAEVAQVDTASRPCLTETLGAERDATRLG